MKKWIWILIALILLIASVIFLNRRQRDLDSSPFALYDYPHTISIENNTRFRADTIVLALAHHVFQMDTLDILIHYIPVTINSGSMQFFAIVHPLPFGKNRFLILLNRRMSFTELLISISHEFIHIEQYLNGDLKISGNYAIWKGDTIDMRLVPYEERPFEIEAHRGQGKIYRRVKKYLF
jgi:hypothetical protein